MRKPVLISVGAAAAALGLAAVLVTSGPGRAQAPKAVADSAKAPLLAPADTGRLRGPRQPIFFRHDIHAGQFKIQCQYCHYSVAVSSEPGIPSMQTCMGCHTVIAGTDSSNKVEIKKLRDTWAQKRPVEWVRVHFVARHVHFPHMRHIKVMGPNACQTCHGDVARMPEIYKLNNVNNMGFCVTCHEQRGVTRDCAVCHY